ncbi:MAG: glycosyltransferase family 8 protein [Alphaproteobacteria bacterium]|nr:glycosyltransferase family 8 protein [Alphaproteobacteria bacterium]
MIAKTNKKIKIPIVFAFDENYKLPASVAIASLLASKKENTEYDIFVLYTDLSENTRAAFDKIARINWVYVDGQRFEKYPHTNYHYPAIVYYRLIIHELFPQYDKMIWSDVDVLFKGDLQNIYQTDIEKYFWGGVIEQKNAYCMFGHNYFSENKNDNIYYSGFMLINCKKMRAENISDVFVRIISNHKDELLCFDLEVLNAACNPIKSLPFEYCMVESIYRESDFNKAYDWKFLKTVYKEEELRKAKKHPRIIHYNYNDSLKIWERPRKQIPDYYWIFLEKSPFFKLSDHYPPKQTLFDYLIYILQCFLAKTLPVKKWRQKLHYITGKYCQRYYGDKN